MNYGNWTLNSLVLVMSIFACQTEEGNGTVGDMEEDDYPAYALVIHGGAGVILKENMPEEKEKHYLDALNEALNRGEKILQAGGKAEDAVVAAITYMEDSPLFNAGKGAVFTNEGTNEMDASIMFGHDLSAGAVGGVTVLKNPILAAKSVSEKSEHVFLVGQGAEEFASLHGVERVDPSYFFTQRRYDAMERLRQDSPDTTQLDHDDKKHGTVGAVALDKARNIVAGTSTGGMTNKKYKRIGDSPIIGAGTYANNKTCGVSSTGHGEYFIRYAVAHAISAQMEFAGKTLDEAARHVINKQLVDAGGTGGVIALDQKGNISMPFNTSGMYRGYVRPGERVVRIYGEKAE